MKIKSLNTGKVYDIEPRKKGENALICPECSHNRKPQNQKKKPFSWNTEKMSGLCHHCGSTFVVHYEQKEKEYIIPEWKNKTQLTDKAVKWFNARMIKQETLNDLEITSVKEWMPQFKKEVECMAFPYKKDGEVVNIKYRGPQKSFKLVSGAELILWNIDAVKWNKEIIIVEGEMDLLSYWDVGIKNVVSVPNGAGKNLEYLDYYMDWFDTVDRIYLAVDADTKGMGLKNELERRFGTEKCLLVNYKDCKDANEYYLKYGGIALQDTIKDAIEIPVPDIVNLRSLRDEIYEYYLHGAGSGLAWDSTFDEALKLETGRLMVVTGIPGHGKSEWVDYLTVRLNIEHGFKCAYFSPENHPVWVHFGKIASKIGGHWFSHPNYNENQYNEVQDYIFNNFFFINPVDDMSIENILDKGKYLVKKHGIKTFVLDPFNKIEHMRNRNETETEYISRVLDRLHAFAQKNDVLVILVAHPRKMNREGGKYEFPTLYDISGSAHFYNKADFGVIVYRMYGDEENPNNETVVRFQKIKFAHLGKGGDVSVRWNYKNGRYEHIDKDVTQWDNVSYLEKREPPEELWEQVDEDVPF